MTEHQIDTLQSEYSLWSRTPERKILQACAKHGVTFVPFSPLGRGFFTGKTSDVSTLPDNDLRCSIARPRFEGQNFIENCKLLEPFADIAQQNDCSPAQLALAWLLAKHDRNMVPIPGTRNIDHMIENAGAAQVDLSDETVGTLDALINESTVKGRRYTDARMSEADAEKD